MSPVYSTEFGPPKLIEVKKSHWYWYVMHTYLPKNILFSLKTIYIGQTTLSFMQTMKIRYKQQIIIEKNIDLVFKFIQFVISWYLIDLLWYQTSKCFGGKETLDRSQVLGRLFALSQNIKKLSHQFWVCFELGIGILNVPRIIFLVVYEPILKLQGLVAVEFQGKNCFKKNGLKLLRNWLWL